MVGFLILTATAFSFASGLYYGLRANIAPDTFWSSLIVGLMFTAPLAIGGYTWYDEFFLAGYLLVNLPSKIAIKRTPSHGIFLGFVAYMMLQAMRGLVFFSQDGLFEAAKKTRWLVFFGLVFLVFLKTSSSRIARQSNQGLAYRVTVGGLCFSTVYLLFGSAALGLTGSTGFTQYAMLSDPSGTHVSPLLALFGSTQYVVCTYLVIIPAALVTIRASRPRGGPIGWLTIAVVLATQILYNSRSGMLFIGLFLTVFLLQNFRSRRILKGLPIFAALVAVALLIQIPFNEVEPSVIIDDLANTMHVGDPDASSPGLQDIDRRIWNYSAIVALTDNTFNLFFGWGLRTSGRIVAPYVYDLFLDARGVAAYSDDVATTGFAALAVDTGGVGLLFLLALWVSCLLELYRECRRIDAVLLLGPTAFVLQLFVGNIFDVALLYLAIMPSGLYLALAKKEELYTPSSF